jgi:hypothetical protein
MKKAAQIAASSAVWYIRFSSAVNTGNETLQHQSLG